MSFTNLYYKRTTATEKSCYICFKSTTTCLATAQAVDFLYVCPGHLTDRGFASQLGETSDGVQSNAARKLDLSPEEIEKVKEEWEEKQRKKKEKEKEDKKVKENEKNKKDSDGSDKKTEEESKKSKAKSPVTSAPSSPPPSAPKHERYALHRDYFAMRLAEHRKRRQATQAKQLAPRLPGAPRDALPS
jgi:hypothetical protein